eukprot:jgi/Ulvmu1/6361/UM029_0069.1
MELSFAGPPRSQPSPAVSSRRAVHRSQVLSRFCGGVGSADVRSAERFRARRSRIVVSSFFGVGAPEAALVGVVAMVVFGPQGLIDAAKAAAAAIRSFQPAIQEINQASSEIRTTITNEMGIDKLQQEFREISQTTRDSLSLNTNLPSTAAGKEEFSNDGVGGSLAANSGRDSVSKQQAEADQLSATFPRDLDSPVAARAIDVDPDIERKRAESAALAWGGAEAAAKSQGSGSEPRRLEDMSLAELERELERRKTLIKAIEDLNA